MGQTVRPPLTPIPAAGPFDRVGVDVLKFPRSALGNQYAIVFIDYLTKWPEVWDQTALTIANLFVREVVCRHGVPSQSTSVRQGSSISLTVDGTSVWGVGGQEGQCANHLQTCEIITRKTFVGFTKKISFISKHKQ